jgi:hypothetical protein
MRWLVILSVVLLTTSCGLVMAPVSLDDVPVSDKNQACVRQCAAVYSDCISRSAPARSAQIACKDSYKVCVNACPQK